MNVVYNLTKNRNIFKNLIFPINEIKYTQVGIYCSLLIDRRYFKQINLMKLISRNLLEGGQDVVWYEIILDQNSLACMLLVKYTVGF